MPWDDIAIAGGLISLRASILFERYMRYVWINPMACLHIYVHSSRILNQTFNNGMY